MKRILILGAVMASFGLAACSDSTDTTPYADPNCKANPFQNNTIPPCAIPVNFSIDDTANKVFAGAETVAGGELQWKGQFAYDTVTRVSFRDKDWAGPFAPLYDDGPWDGYTVASGNTLVTKYGHEPKGSKADDHILGITVFVYTPAAGTNEVYSYGLVDHTFGDGWLWQGPNGSLTVAGGATAPIKADGLTLAPFGTTDLRLTLDTNNLEPLTCAPTPCTPPAWDLSGGVKVKGSFWGWYEVPTKNLGGGIYQLVLSDVAGPKPKPLYHSGLLNSCSDAQFVFVLYGAGGTSKEYKVGTPPKTGVTADTMKSGGAWTAATVNTKTDTDKNTFIVAPPIAPATTCN